MIATRLIIVIVTIVLTFATMAWFHYITLELYNKANIPMTMYNNFKQHISNYYVFAVSVFVVVVIAVLFYTKTKTS